MMDIQRVTRLNPKTLAPPVGKYSHVTIVPKEANIYVFSGQIGNDKNGIMPSDFNQQVYNTFENIGHILTSQDLSSENIIKVNIWATKEIEWQYFDSIWTNLFNNNNPSMTVAYIAALGLPEIHLEIEIWAAK